MPFPIFTRPNTKTVVLEESGPITVTSDGQIIENKRIIADGTHAITCSGFKDVVLRSSHILHKKARGISINNSPRFTMQDVAVDYANAPAAGPHPGVDNDHLNILVDGGSHDFKSNRVRCRDGSTGIYVIQSDRAIISFLEGYDFRGPMSRGQLVQFNASNDSVLQDFSCVIDRNKAWTEDNINLGKANNCIIRRGLLDGNNSPSGVGVLSEPGSTGSSNLLVEDVDCINQGNGGIASVDLTQGSGSYGATFRRVRVRGMVNTSWQSRGFPSSSNGNITSGLHFRSRENAGAGGTFIEECEYFYDPADNGGLPLNLVVQMPTITWATDRATDLVSNDFTPRAPITLIMPWE